MFKAGGKDNFEMKNCNIFLISAQNIDYGYSIIVVGLRSTTIYVMSKNKKNIKLFHLKIVIFTAVKIAIYYIGMLM